MTRAQSGKSTYLLISLAVVTLDQWSKWLVERLLPEHIPFQVIPSFLAFTHVKNTGVAFGLFAAEGSFWPTAILTILGVLALTVVGIYFWQTPREDRRMLIALSLILGGAVGTCSIESHLELSPTSSPLTSARITGIPSMLPIAPSRSVSV